MSLYEIRAHLIGLIILGLMLWLFIKLHNFISKNNIPIENLSSNSLATNSQAIHFTR